MKNYQRKELNLFYLIFLISFSYLFLKFGYHQFLLNLFLNYPAYSTIALMWTTSFFFARNSSRKTKQKIFFYSLFITFVLIYLVNFHFNSKIILAQTPSQECLTKDECPSGQLCCNGKCVEPVTCEYKRCECDCTEQCWCWCDTKTEEACPGACPGSDCSTDQDCYNWECDSDDDCDDKDGWYCENGYSQYRDYYCRILQKFVKNPTKKIWTGLVWESPQKHIEWYLNPNEAWNKKYFPNSTKEAYEDCYKTLFF